jgi:cell division septation protein DedD
LNSYIIQVGAFREERYASAVFAALERAGFCPRYEPHRDLTRVLIPAVERGDLARVREKIKALGLGEPYVRQ